MNGTIQKLREYAGEIITKGLCNYYNIPYLLELGSAKNPSSSSHSSLASSQERLLKVGNGLMHVSSPGIQPTRQFKKGY